MNLKKTLAIAAAAGALTALALPALADTTMYGSARVGTNWNKIPTTGTDHQSDFDMPLIGTSRLGVNFSSGDIGGKVELGFGTIATATPNTNALYGRLLYGTYKFGAGKILVGQDYNSYYLISAQTTGGATSGDNVNNSFGALYDGRQPQIKVTLNNGLYFAAIQPSVSSGTAGSKIMIPKLNVGYAGKAGTVGFGAGVVGQLYKNQAINEDILSYLGYANATVGAGPLTIKANLGYGQNMGNMGFLNNGLTSNTYVVGAKEDTNSLEGYVQVSLKASDMLSLNAAVGYAVDSNDTYAKDDNRMLVFVNAPMTVAKGFSITPEVAMIDELDTLAGGKGTKTYYIGAKWQMDF